MGLQGLHWPKIVRMVPEISPPVAISPGAFFIVWRRLSKLLAVRVRPARAFDGCDLPALVELRGAPRPALAGSSIYRTDRARELAPIAKVLFFRRSKPM